uniref:Putative site-specific DNA endonuclease n=1 Tax=Chlorella vulgaris TaxID=3077 RepID=Q9B7G8_CHLVU|nr:putative site-specific DNA endonuclease [Chlorella vulgaris]QGN75125.1 hypothetical protein [Chlorella vulgaris]
MNLQTQWIVGFVDGEGCFHVAINSQKTSKLAFQVLPEFTITQHKRDVQVLYGLKNFFGCGVVRVNHGDRYCYRVRGFPHLRDIILPFFEKHKLLTKKRVDFEKFRKVILKMNCGDHLTPQGIDEIRKIQETMNRKGIKFFEKSS